GAALAAAPSAPLGHDFTTSRITAREGNNEIHSWFSHSDDSTGHVRPQRMALLVYDMQVGICSQVKAASQIVTGSAICWRSRGGGECEWHPDEPVRHLEGCGGWPLLRRKFGLAVRSEVARRSSCQ